MNTTVEYPKHYTSHPSGVECIEIAEHYNFCIGNAIKYLWRAGLKHEEGKRDADKEIEDLQKAVWYIQRRISYLQKESQTETLEEARERLHREFKELILSIEDAEV